MEGIDLSQVGVAGVFVILVLREIFTFLKNQKDKDDDRKKKDPENMEYFILRYHETEMKSLVKSINQSFGQIFDTLNRIERKLENYK